MPFKVIAWRELTGRFHIEVRQDDFTNEITVEVVKTTNGATVPTDEPLFLLRARDVLAAPLLLCYPRRVVASVKHSALECCRIRVARREARADTRRP
jgi:hypothetical protein